MCNLQADVCVVHGLRAYSMLVVAGAHVPLAAAAAAAAPHPHYCTLFTSPCLPVFSTRQELDLASCSRDLSSAVAWLRCGEAVAAVLDRDAHRLALELPDLPGWRHCWDTCLGMRRQHLVRVQSSAE
jgi:hypothetical protein